MDHIPHLTPGEPNATPRQLLHTALFAAALLIIPLLLGTLLVLTVHKIRPVSTPPPTADKDETRFDTDATNLLQLVERRRDRRGNGDDIGELNIRIWAAHACQPTALFHIDPPDPAKRWNWHLSQDGLFALAVSVQTDTADRRAVGLFDLVADRWLWKKNLPWPDSYEAPYVFNRHVVLRYSKNAKIFAMEIDEEGAVVGIDMLRKAVFKKDEPLYPVPGFRGTPVAIRHGVLFTSEAESSALVGNAMERMPGLYFAGKGDDNTLFSGNGRLKFSIQNGRVTVADSLTQTVLQRIDAWPHTTNTFVTGARVTHDGSQLSLFLKTTFGGTPTATREWSVSIATYTGTITPTFNPDALLARPQRVCQRQTSSSDGQWKVSVTESNLLSIVALAQNRPVAHLDLGNALSLRQPVDHIAFLEEDRHVVIRQRDNFWLLDFDAVRNHADLLARKAASAEAVVQTAPPVTVPADQPPLAVSTNAPAETPSAAPRLALRAEWYARHQAWGYAAAALEATVAESAADGRAPRVNPLPLAHAYLLSGHKQKARLVCREALLRLYSDASDYNRMVRYHLQGLLFSQP